jgi:hypothetical protein
MISLAFKGKTQSWLKEKLIKAHNKIDSKTEISNFRSLHSV